MLGVLCGLTFGESCRSLKIFGDAYVGLLQMTVLPYLVVALISNLARLDVQQARRFGVASLLTMLCLAVVGVVLILLASFFLPASPGVSSFFIPSVAQEMKAGDAGAIERFIPVNVFRALSSDYIPAVVVFCLFFGAALIAVPKKEPLLHVLDACSTALTRVSTFLVRLAPYGLFFLAADAAGTIRIDELSRLQAYLIMLAATCALTTFAVLPLIISSVTGIRASDVMRAASEPLLTALATGKLIVVLPLIVEKCEMLLGDASEPDSQLERSTASVVVPMAYPFPHLGKVLALLFIPFAAWYVGKPLSTPQTIDMAVTGTASSFASPLVSVPYLLDRFELPQDLIALFLLPGFITTRIGDIVGVMSLMTITLIVCKLMQKDVKIRWRRLAGSAVIVTAAFVVAGSLSRWYLESTVVRDDLDQRLLSLEILNLYENTVVHRPGETIPDLGSPGTSTLDRIKSEKRLLVGYHQDHVPYSYFNHEGRLVGMDVEMMHRLAENLQVRLEFVPYQYATLIDQLNRGEFDVGAGGVIIAPHRLVGCGFSESYETATFAVVVPDHRRAEFESWEEPDRADGTRLGIVFQDIAASARRLLPDIEFVTIDSYQSFFEGKHSDLDGIVMAAEEGAAWNVFYPQYTVIVPKPQYVRPVGLALRSSDPEWGRFLDQWLEMERLDGTLDSLREYWVRGGGTKKRPRRWCIVQDVLGWTSKPE